MVYNLRKYNNKDYEFVYEIKKQAYKNYVVENWGEWDDEKQHAFFDDYINKQSKFIDIIVFEGEDIGFLDANINKDEFEINNICIKDKFRGQGLGTAILKDLLDKYSKIDIKLQYFKSNRVGNLYKRLGFVVCGETKTHYQMIKIKRK